MSAEQIVKTYLAIGLALLIRGVIKAFRRRKDGQRHWAWMKAKVVNDGMSTTESAGMFLVGGLLFIAMIWPIYLADTLADIWKGKKP